uniref:Uncharacterized protein n=1 Tax=Coturnix japonica TaxID=93934 RepID=A0A8C2TD61_COTJA
MSCCKPHRSTERHQLVRSPPLWLKVKQITQLPVTKSLRGSLSPTGAFDPEDSTSWTHTVCSAFPRPPLFSSKERFLLLVSCCGDFSPWFQKPHGPT